MRVWKRVGAQSVCTSPCVLRDWAQIKSIRTIQRETLYSWRLTFTHYFVLCVCTLCGGFSRKIYYRLYHWKYTFLLHICFNFAFEKCARDHSSRRPFFSRFIYANILSLRHGKIKSIIWKDVFRFDKTEPNICIYIKGKNIYFYFEFQIICRLGIR